MIHTLKQHTLDFIYPAFCVGCERDGSWICDRCINAVMRRLPDQRIPNGFSSFHTVGRYADPVLRQLIRAIKYRTARVCIARLNDLLDQFIERHVLFRELLQTPELRLFYVPSDELRIRERGIDHTFVIAELFALKYQNIHLRDSLIKTRNVMPNAKLPSSAARKGNTSDAFMVTERIEKPCLLIDDVYTSGATMSACKNALRTAGAKAIHGFTLAVGR